MTDTTTGTAKVTLPADDQILITRDFAAPRQHVYRAWTTPDLVKRWWAGKRGTVTSVDIDLRVGGQWRYVMLANGNFEVAFHGEYREIVPNERLVHTEVYETPGALDVDAPVVTVTFAESGDRTTVTILTETHTKELRDAILESGMEGGMQESMDALEEVAVSLD
ncbi:MULTISPECIES: SRPBCC family protein [Amycolatopsis]|uniref:SRPBCC family protein n=1 Tax=Amycolatopsis dendrobii TaxID=2760662 RepID=A0A7W3VYX5_9PSEU|nr:MULTISPECIES: SRPBCC family protein [Amycolatopsis]MBB1155237.1 SRPBCC family protein [Amycolatopsis dendrobii]UKD54816.1 SRPBCC family protein [Amycolatopsis sp. FU40]